MQNDNKKAKSFATNLARWPPTEEKKNNEKYNWFDNIPFSIEFFIWSFDESRPLIEPSDGRTFSEGGLQSKTVFQNWKFSNQNSARLWSSSITMSTQSLAPHTDRSVSPHRDHFLIEFLHNLVRGDWVLVNGASKRRIFFLLSKGKKTSSGNLNPITLETIQNCKMDFTRELESHFGIFHSSILNSEFMLSSIRISVITRLADFDFIQQNYWDTDVRLPNTQLIWAA